MSFTNNGVKFNRGFIDRRFFQFWFRAAEIFLSIIFVISLAGPMVFPKQAQAVAGVSKYLSYQGRLTNSSGSALGGSGTNYCFKFSIYDDATVGAPDNRLWPTAAPATSTVNVINGVFNVGIGEADDLSVYDFSGTDPVYLNIEVGAQVSGSCTDAAAVTETLAPRQRMDASAYARVAYSLYGGDARIGTGSGVTSGQKLLKLDVKSVADVIGAGSSCTPNGSLWYNSANTRALVCNNGLIQEVGTSTIPIAGIKEQSAGSAIGAGTVNFSGSNNITISQTGNTLQFSVSQSNQALSGSNGSFAFQTATFGNLNGMSFYTSNGSIVGSYTVPSQTVQPVAISGSNGSFVFSTVTFGNLNGLSFYTSNGSIVGSYTAGAGGGIAGIAGSGASTVTNGTLQFANGNGVSFGLNGSTMTASIGAIPVADVAIADIGTAGYSGTNTSKFAAGDHIHRGVNAWNVTGIASTFYGAFAHSAGNLIALSTGGNATAGTIGIHNLLSSATTASAVTTANVIGAMASRFALEGHQHAGVGQFGVSNLGNTVGNTGLQYGNFVLSGQANITLSQITATGTQTVHTIGISAPAGGAGGAATISYFDNMVGNSVTGALASVNSSNNSMWVFPLNNRITFPGAMTANTMYLDASISGSTATLSVAHTSKVWFAIYTISNNSTLNLLNSVETSWNLGAATNNSTFYQGQRYISIHSSKWSAQPTFNEGSIYIGALRVSSSISAAQTFAWFGQHQWVGTLQRSGTVGSNQAAATNMGAFPYVGIYTSNTTGYSSGFPATINISQLNKASLNANFIPHIIFNNMISSF